MLLDVFVRLLFSNRTELGWDGSIQRVAPQVYKIRVGDKWYTTTKKLCDISAEEIEGRATRVWEAESEDKTRVVVKDVWMGESQRPEHELIQEILEKNDDEAALEIVQDFLFTVNWSPYVHRPSSWWSKLILTHDLPSLRLLAL